MYVGQTNRVHRIGSFPRQKKGKIGMIVGTPKDRLADGSRMIALEAAILAWYILLLTLRSDD